MNENGRMDRRGMIRGVGGLLAGAGLVGVGQGRVAFGQAFLARGPLPDEENYTESYVTSGVTTYDTSFEYPETTLTSSTVDDDCSKTFTHATYMQMTGFSGRNYTQWRYEVGPPPGGADGILDLGLGKEAQARETTAFGASFLKSAAPVSEWEDVSVSEGWTVQSMTVASNDPATGVNTQTATYLLGIPPAIPPTNNYWEMVDGVAETWWRTFASGVRKTQGCTGGTGGSGSMLDLGLSR